MTSVSKYVYLDKLDDINNKYNNTYHRSTIKMKLADLKPSTYSDFSKIIIYQDSKLKIVDTVRVSKYKNVFAKGKVCPKLV